MAFELTESAELASQQTSIKPILILEIDGISTLFGAVAIKKFVRVGDEDLFVGDSWTIGGLAEIEDQSPLITFSSGGTSTSISQNLLLDKGKGESISTMQITVVDKNQEITNLISPGKVVTDIMGRKCRVWFGFQQTAWKEDFLIIFRGSIQAVDSGAGFVTFTISAPDQKKKSELFIKLDTELSASMGSGDSVANVLDTSKFLLPITGPSGSIDTDLKTCIRIDNEIMRYEAKSGTQFQTLTRGYLGTAAVAHSSGANVESYYRIEGNGVDLALKLMHSGLNDYYIKDKPVSSFNVISATDIRPNIIFFDGLNVFQEYGVTVGDFITTTGATNGANNVSLKEVINFEIVDTGTFLEIDGVSFVDETDSPALISFRSRYDVWPEGLRMGSDEVDVTQHERIRGQYLSSFGFDFSIQDEIDGRDWLAEQIYNPMGAFSLPRNAQSSMGIHTPPLPNQNIRTIDWQNVTNAKNLKIKRSLSKNFYNGILYKFEQDRLEEDDFGRGVLTVDGQSLTQIPVGRKVLTIEAAGMRDALQGASLATTATSRRLSKYRYGAEYLDSVKVAAFRDGFKVEVGDIVMMDIGSLKVSDIQSGTRAGDARLFECVNKTLNLTNGEVTLSLVDTSFDKDSRRALVGPSSVVKSGIDQKTFVIEPSYSSKYLTNEWKKWAGLVGTKIHIHSADYAQSGFATLSSVSGNTITLGADLGFVPSAGMVMRAAPYIEQRETIKIIYAYISDGVLNFADGKPPYVLF